MTRRHLASILACVLAAGLTAGDAMPAFGADALVMRMDGGAEPPSPAAAIRAALAGTDGAPGAPGLAIETRDGALAARAFKPALRRGEADLAAIPLTVLARESGLYAIDRIPYLATTRDVARALFDAAAPHLARRLAEDGLVLLALEPRPAIGLVTRVPVRRAADLGGRRLWTPDATTRRLAELAGAITETDAARAEALFLDAADAMAMLRARTLAAGPWTFVKLEGWHPARAVVMSGRRFAALPDGVKPRLAALGTAARDDWWRDEAMGSAAAQRTLAEAGHAVEPAAAQLARDLARFGEQMASEWLPGAGADGAALLGGIGLGPAAQSVRDTRQDPSPNSEPASRHGPPGR